MKLLIMSYGKKLSSLDLFENERLVMCIDNKSVADRKILFVLPCYGIDTAVLKDVLSAYRGAMDALKEGASNFNVEVFAVDYNKISEDTVKRVVSIIEKGGEDYIGIIVYGEEPSKNLLNGLLAQSKFDIPVITIANVSNYPIGASFAFRMWFDIASLCHGIKQMINDAKLCDKDKILIAYNDAEYGKTVAEKLTELLSEKNESRVAQVSYNSDGTFDRKEDIAKYMGVVVVGYGTSYDNALKKIDGCKYKNFVFTDNYITEKYDKFANLKICGLTVDEIVPYINYHETWEELNKIVPRKRRKKFVALPDNEDNESSDVEPPIYFASKESVLYYKELIDGEHQNFRNAVLQKWWDKQFRCTCLGSAIIHPLGETKINLKYKWIGPIDAHVYASDARAFGQDKECLILNKIETVLLKHGMRDSLSTCINNEIRDVLKDHLGLSENTIANDNAKIVASVFEIFTSRLPIQINGSGRILADNDAINIYIVIDNNELISIEACADKKCDVSKIRGIVLAKTNHLAECLWVNKDKDVQDKNGFLHGLRRENGIVFSSKHKAFKKLLKAFISIAKEVGYGGVVRYIIPEIRQNASEGGDTQQSDSDRIVFEMFDFRHKLSRFELSTLMVVANRVFATNRLATYFRANEIANTKSAIGSIMARNGSHNIGSHVLAALSHNVGTMPDDRVLYQYIQQRMDYVATVTTDVPTWTQPTMLLGSLIKGFLSQRHLLDHIAESEGLSAWRFQGRKLSEKECEQQHWLEFHVRKKKDDGAYEELITYPSGDVTLGEDVALAIPGGTVGCHAFYTIVENIIRNAAKHDWAVNHDKQQWKNLPIYIDFDNNPKYDYVEFEIWTRLSKVVRKKNEPYPEPCCNVKEWDKKLEEGQEKDLTKFARKPLSQRLQIMIERPFIKTDGQLRRENWGLAEMKISAGYLNRCDVGTIGGLTLDNYNPEKALLLPVTLPKEYGNKESGDFLVYKFVIPKPRELLIIVEDEVYGEIKGDRINQARNRGVFIKTWNEILQNGKNSPRALELNYRFVIHSKVTMDILHEKGVKFPFRVFSGAEVKDEILKSKIPQFSNYESFVGQLCDSKNEIDAVLNALLIDVYKCWGNHIKEYRKLEKIGLLIAPFEDEKAGGHSLISDDDVLKYVMTECFQTCVEQYHKMSSYNCGVAEDTVYSVFKELCDHPRIIPDDLGHGNIQSKVAKWLYKWIRHLDDSFNSAMKERVDSIAHDLEKGYDVMEDSNDGKEKPSKKKDVQKIAITEIERILNKSSVDGFIKYIESVNEQVKSLFRQYEENIVSLPRGYKKEPTATNGDRLEEDNFGAIDKVAFNADGLNNDIKWIAYRRHDNSLKNGIVFAEPLSGTQSYLTEIIRVAQYKSDGDSKVKDCGFCTRLLENGLLRMLIIDERVAKFVREHSTEVEDTYKSMGIAVLDDQLKGAANESAVAYFRSFKITGREDPQTPCNEFEILIIHQGVLDKWFPKDKNSKEAMQSILEGLKKSFKYVAITTGRGSPANIPEDAHLIPFAVVESALFRKYPEKLLLVDAVMNALPVGKQEV